MSAHDPRHLLDIIEQQNGALEKLLAEREALRAQVDALGGKHDALARLQAIYNDPEESTGNKVRAASAAVGFERPKMSVAVHVGPSLLRERLDAKLIDLTPAKDDAA